MSETQRSLKQFSQALNRLEEALAVSLDENPLALDAVIQRFEFVMELAWNTLKRALLEQGVETTTPKDTLEKAFANAWIDEEAIWLQMLRARNQTAHTYNEQTALNIYRQLSGFIPVLNRLRDFLNHMYTP